jgi:predicted regulator of Ras-like GTPase activity (Roadblock/LC7/MglB family)
MLQRLLATFCAVPGVVGVTLLDSQGELRASILAPDFEGQDAASGMSQLLHSAERLGSEGGLGRLEQLWLESESGSALLAPLAAGYVLLITSQGESNLGRLRYEVETRLGVFEDLL